VFVADNRPPADDVIDAGRFLGVERSARAGRRERRLRGARWCPPVRALISPRLPVPQAPNSRLPHIPARRPAPRVSEPAKPDPSASRMVTCRAARRTHRTGVDPAEAGQPGPCVPGGDGPLAHLITGL